MSIDSSPTDLSCFAQGCHWMIGSLIQGRVPPRKADFIYRCLVILRSSDAVSINFILPFYIYYS